MCRVQSTAPAYLNIISCIALFSESFQASFYTVIFRLTYALPRISAAADL